jgi:hypothetical protein
MNKQLNIKTRRLLLSPSFVILLIGMVVVLVLGGPSVQAQTATADGTATTDSTATKSPTTTTPSGTVDSSISIPVKGSVTDPNGTITVSGSVIVSCRRVIDVNNAVTTPLALLDFDFSGVKGTSGTVKAQTVYVTGDNHASEIRPFQASDTVIVSTPYYDSSKDPLSAKTMLVNVTLNFDVSTGKVTSGSISVGNNVTTAATVGTVSATPQ